MNALFVDLLPVLAANGSLLQRGSPVDPDRSCDHHSQAHIEPRLTAISAIASCTVRSHMFEHSRHQVSELDPSKGFRRHAETGAIRGDPSRSEPGE